VDTPDWVDMEGDGCDWYKANNNPGCPKYGDYGGNKGPADDNCCYCFVTASQSHCPSSRNDDNYDDNYDDNLYSNSNESQNENIANETTFSSVSVSEPEIATYALAGASMSSSSTSSTSLTSAAPKDKPKMQICYYAGNKKCPNVPQKKTAGSCRCN
jgi:hypothetical protein